MIKASICDKDRKFKRFSGINQIIYEHIMNFTIENAMNCSAGDNTHFRWFLRNSRIKLDFKKVEKDT